MQKYRLTKIKQVENPLAQTAKSIEEYRNSLESNDYQELSPSVDYYVEGTLLKEPVVGDSLLMERTNRNGVEIYGVMSTTEIKTLKSFENCIELTTENSVYRLEKI